MVPGYKVCSPNVIGFGARTDNHRRRNSAISLLSNCIPSFATFYRKIPFVYSSIVDSRDRAGGANILYSDPFDQHQSSRVSCHVIFQDFLILLDLVCLPLSQGLSQCCASKGWNLIDLST